MFQLSDRVSVVVLILANAAWTTAVTAFAQAVEQPGINDAEYWVVA